MSFSTTFHEPASPAIACDAGVAGDVAINLKNTLAQLAWMIGVRVVEDRPQRYRSGLAGAPRQAVTALVPARRPARRGAVSADRPLERRIRG